MSEPNVHIVKIRDYRGTADLTNRVVKCSAWCEESFGDKKDSWDYMGLGVFVFKNPQHAIMFKLVHG